MPIPVMVRPYLFNRKIVHRWCATFDIPYMQVEQQEITNNANSPYYINIVL